MNWLTNFVRPKIRALVAPKEVPENMWVKCPDCGAMLFRKDLAASHNVCHHCLHHLRWPIHERLNHLFDDGAYERIELPKAPADPLRFKDTKRYAERLRDAQSKTGEKDAALVVQGRIGGKPAVVVGLNFDFMGGSMGVAVGEAFLAGARQAVLQKAALVAIPASGGARMQEGILSLMQMPRTVIGVEQVKDAGLPYIVILTDPTTGGVSASFAMLGDVHIAEPGAQIGFAGARVIEETIRQSLPDGFQTAEYLKDHGMVDMVVPRGEMRQKLGRLLSILMERQVSERMVDAQAPAAGLATAAGGNGAAALPPGSGQDKQDDRPISAVDKPVAPAKASQGDDQAASATPAESGEVADSAQSAEESSDNRPAPGRPNEKAEETIAPAEAEKPAS